MEVQVEVVASHTPTDSLELAVSAFPNTSLIEMKTVELVDVLEVVVLVVVQVVVALGAHIINRAGCFTS